MTSDEAIGNTVRLLQAAERETNLMLMERLEGQTLAGRLEQGRVSIAHAAEIGPLDVVYRFDGEFWTDEVDDLVVKMEDRCID